MSSPAILKPPDHLYTGCKKHSTENVAYWHYFFIRGMGTYGNLSTALTCKQQTDIAWMR